MKRKTNALPYYLHLNKKQFNLIETIGDSVHHIRIEQNYEIIAVGNDIVNVFADEARIEQVINNFIINAIKYAPDSKQVTVTVWQRVTIIRWIR